MLYGKVLGINSLISYSQNKSLNATVEEAVFEYLENKI